jgi:acetyl-CoA carboxylase carboxyltransferase component
MYEQVLKFGAFIVDALRSYTQPVITYIPPFGELRGGAWAVVDTQINPMCIRMLADPERLHYLRSFEHINNCYVLKSWWRA